MEKIGISKEGNVIAVMSHEEFDALATLALAIEGESLVNIHPGIGRNFGAVDIETALGTVKEFAENRILMNQVIERLVEITEAWGRADQKGKDILKQAEDFQATCRERLGQFCIEITKGDIVT